MKIRVDEDFEAVFGSEKEELHIFFVI